QIDGKIDTTIKIKKEKGVYVPTPEGDKRVTAGSVDIKYGNITWDYDQNKVLDVNLGTTGNGFTDSSFHTASFRLTASNLGSTPVNIDTTGDLVSTQSYDGNVFLPKEGVYIFGKGQKEAYLYGNLKTNGSVHVIAQSPISLSWDLKVDANEVKLITTEDVYNKGDLSSLNMMISAKDFVNSGKITIKSDGEFNANVERNIVNRTGEINALNGKIFLTAKNGFIRNGLAHYADSSDIKTNRPVAISTCTNDCETKINPLHSIQNVMNVGAYYRYDNNSGTSYINYLIIPSSIRGSSIQMDAKVVENINPYFEISAIIDGSCNKIEPQRLGTSEECFRLNETKSQQIAIEASEKLLINAEEAIINASAKIATTNAHNSIMQLSAPYVINERYRLLSMLTRGEDDTQIGAAFYSSSEYLSLDAYILSPVGKI
ncbi:MAG: hypothetical protein OXE99_03925, partial [Cellvibrionales bacterium]|nr:hypothetical protein [Cellvibrionales bacterium]